MPLNIDVLRIIADYVNPCPVQYSQLATVNRDFYKVFTSDKLWRQLNAYDLDGDIFRHFIEKATKLTRFYWKCPCLNRQIGFGDPKDKYLVLGFLANFGSPYETGSVKYDDKHLLKLAIFLNPGVAAIVDDKEVITKGFITHGAEMMKYIRLDVWPRLTNDKQLVLKVLKNCPPGPSLSISLAVDMMDDLDVAQVLFERCPRIITYIDRRIQPELVVTRQDVLSALHENPKFLCENPQYNEDAELVKLAFSGDPTTVKDTEKVLGHKLRDNKEVIKLLVQKLPVNACLSWVWNGHKELVKQTIASMKIRNNLNDLVSLTAVENLRTHQHGDPELAACLIKLAGPHANVTFDFERGNDREFMWYQVGWNAFSYTWCSQTLQSDKSFLMRALDQGEIPDLTLHYKFLEDDEVMEKVARKSPKALRWVHHLPLSLVKNVDYDNLNDAPDCLLSDVDFMLRAVQRDYRNIVYAQGEALSHPAIMRVLLDKVKYAGQVPLVLSDELFEKFVEKFHTTPIALCLATMEERPQQVSIKELKEAIKLNGATLRFYPELIHDIEFDIDSIGPIVMPK